MPSRRSRTHKRRRGGGWFSKKICIKKPRTRHERVVKFGKHDVSELDLQHSFDNPRTAKRRLFGSRDAVCYSVKDYDANKKEYVANKTPAVESATGKSEGRFKGVGDFTPYKIEDPYSLPKRQYTDPTPYKEPKSLQQHGLVEENGDLPKSKLFGQTRLFY